MEFGLSGKNVLVTGSTKGLGRAIAEVMAYVYRIDKHAGDRRRKNNKAR